MHPSPRVLLAVPLALALLAVGVMPADAKPEAPCTSARQADGTSAWVGAPSEKVSAAALALSQIVDEHPEAYAGVEYCANYSAVKVYVKAGQRGSELASLRKQFPGNVIKTVPVPHSQAELAATVEDVSQSAAIDKATASVTPDPATGEVLVEVPANSSWKAPASKARTRTIKAKVTTDSGAASRFGDSAPFTSGAHIESTKAVCSLGPRIRVNGAYTVMTAGHCGAGPWYSRNVWSPTTANYVGTQWVTSWPGNAYRYGDWSLIRGKSYSGNVFNGAASSTAVLPGATANFSPLPLGHKLCSSGQTTGTLCKYTVSGTNTSRIVSGYMVGHLTWMTTGQGCKGGFAAGDSGGAMFYNNGGGKMVYVGLMTSLNTSECTWRFTQLSGIRAWNPTATW